jgi:hypothetical protein
MPDAALENSSEISTENTSEEPAVSATKILANRINAQKSTGPKSFYRQSS